MKAYGFRTASNAILAGLLAANLSCKTPDSSLDSKVSDAPAQQATHQTYEPISQQTADHYLSKWIEEREPEYGTIGEINYQQVTSELADLIQKGAGVNAGLKSLYSPETIGWGAVYQSEELKNTLEEYVQRLDRFTNLGQMYAERHGLTDQEELWKSFMDVAITQTNLILDPTESNFGMYQSAIDQLTEQIEDPHNAELAYELAKHYYENPESHARAYNEARKLIHDNSELTSEYVRQELGQKLLDMDKNFK